MINLDSSSSLMRTGGVDNFFHCDTCGKFMHELLSAKIRFHYMWCNKDFTHTPGSLVAIRQGVATAMSWRIRTAVSKEQCITTALSASRLENLFSTKHHSELSGFLILKKISLPAFTVSVRLHKGYQCAAMWAHNSSGVHERDESAPSVSVPFSLEFRNCVTWPDKW